LLLDSLFQAAAETVFCHPEFISGSYKPLILLDVPKAFGIQHDIFNDFAHSATACFTRMTAGALKDVL
jgi:hypothetical protein